MNKTLRNAAIGLTLLITSTYALQREYSKIDLNENQTTLSENYYNRQKLGIGQINGYEMPILYNTEKTSEISPTTKENKAKYY